MRPISRSNAVLAAGALIAAAVAGFLAAPSSADTTCDKYASVSGSDAATGAATSPYRTAQKLAASLVAGQTGCLLGGTYSGNLTIRTSGITLTTAPGSARATVTGGYVYVPAGTTGVTLTNLKLDGAGSSAVSIQLYGNNTTLSNNEITNQHLGQSCVTVGEYEGSYATVVSNAVIDNNVIHGCGQTANGNHDHGVYLASTRYAKVTNNVFYDNFGGWGIQLWADAHYSDVSHNVVDANYSGNIIIAGGSYSSLGPSSNNSFTNNILTWPRSGYNVTAYWEGAKGTNNVFAQNCVFGASANFDTGDGGFTASGTIAADPLFVNRTAHDYTLKAGSPCAGMGPTAPAAAPTTATTTTTAPAPTFSLSASSSAVTVYAGSSVTDAIAVTGANGFSGTVALTVTGLPATSTGAFSPSSVTGAGSSTLTVGADARAKRGVYSVTVTGTSGTLTRSVALTVRVRR
jgi:hypothetical protein